MAHTLLGYHPMYLPISGLSKRIYLAFLLVALIPTSVAGLIGIVYSLETLKRETLGSLAQELDIRTENIAQIFSQLSAELFYLAGSATVREVQRTLPSNAAARERLAQDFMRFAAHSPLVYQIRYLADDGQEIVRVDRHGKTPTVATVLQNKADRYYFQAAMGVPPEHLYISPLDLNIEFGQVEQPQRPVIRLALQVPGNRARGLLIINLHADILLSQIQQLAKTRGGTAYLFDRAGHYLAQTPAASQLAFTMQPVSRLHTAYGQAQIEQITQGARGTAAVNGQILSFAPVRLPAYYGGVYGWSLALAFPERRLFLAIFRLSALYLVLLASLIATALGGYFVLQRLLGPLRDLTQESEAIAAGDFSRRVQIEGEDEIAHLGRQFNRMAERLQSSIATLRQHQAHLAAEVQARTAELERERAFLSAVIAHSGDGILAVDGQGQCILANQAATTLLAGLSPGASVAAVLPHWADWAHTALTLGEYCGEFQQEKHTLNIVLTRAADGYSVAILHDMSEARRLQDERRELDRQMFQMEKMTTLGELAMGVAHEIGNPLAGMKAVVQTMRYDEDMPPYLLECSLRLESEIDRLITFLRGFHNFATPRPLARSACDLSLILEDVLFWTRKDAKNQAVQLHSDIAEGLYLYADPHQLKQVLLNLVINALHAMPNGGTLSIHGSRTDQYAHLTLADTGTGIAAEILPHIFEPFFTTRDHGSGLGLAVARQIVLDHQAQMSVQSTLGEGSCFSLHWPLTDEIHLCTNPS